jgi:hypothetical protein
MSDFHEVRPPRRLHGPSQGWWSKRSGRLSA